MVAAAVAEMVIYTDIGTQNKEDKEKQEGDCHGEEFCRTNCHNRTREKGPSAQVAQRHYAQALTRPPTSPYHHPESPISNQSSNHPYNHPAARAGWLITIMVGHSLRGPMPSGHLGDDVDVAGTLDDWINRYCALGSMVVACNKHCMVVAWSKHWRLVPIDTRVSTCLSSQGDLQAHRLTRIFCAG
uniref:Uncharacterized protein n=1 Tax=Leersia perrieri TaxID=77586 RepID=A0A0D9WK50_9ORYZ